MKNKHPGLKKNKIKRQKALKVFEEQERFVSPAVNEFVKKVVRGRPTVFTDEVIAKLTRAFSVGCPVTEACFHANINETTFYRNAPIGSDLFNYFMELKNTPILLARQTVVNDAKRPEGARWLLERKLPKEFGAKFLGDPEMPISVKHKFSKRFEELLIANRIEDEKKPDKKKK